MSFTIICDKCGHNQKLEDLMSTTTNNRYGIHITGAVEAFFSPEVFIECNKCKVNFITIENQ